MNVVEKRDYIHSRLHHADEELIDQFYELLRKEEILFQSKDSDISSCFGAWEDNRSAEEIINEIRAGRVNVKEIEGFE